MNMEKTSTWMQGGYLYPVYDMNTENNLKTLLKTQKKFDLNIDWVDAKKRKRTCSGINNTNLLGGTFSPEDGSASPLKVTELI